MDTYIVRIYRRGGNDPARLAGVVEDVGADEVKAFGTTEDLLRIIMGASGPAGGGLSPGPPRRRLPVIVRGTNVLGKRFSEKTFMEKMKAGGGLLLLKNKVKPKARLRLVIDPEHSSLEVGCMVVSVGKGRGLRGAEVSFDRRL